MKNIHKYLVAGTIDILDFLMGVFGVTLNLFIPGSAIAINNVRDMVWDTVSIPILYTTLGNSSLFYILELAIPGEFDFVIPTATILTYLKLNKIIK